MSVVLSRYFWRFVVFVAIAVAVFGGSELAIASQFTERAATLVGPRDNYAIPFYIRPAPNQQPVGYGMSGDAVTVTDQFGDYLMEDDPSATWSHIRLEKAPYTEGWLRGRFLSMQSAEVPTENPSIEADSP